MNKELEAFNGICCNTNQSYPDFQKQRKIVETALKRLQEIDKVMFLNNQKMEKQDKILRIIKDLMEPKIDDKRLSVEVGQIIVQSRKLTQEEYDLLKEVLL